MKAVNLIVTCFTAGAIISYLLLPSKQEIDAMLFSAKEADPKLSAEHLPLDHTSTLSVRSLTQMHIKNHQIDKATALMEEFVDRHPEDVEAIKVLASLYQQMERYEEYAALLETLVVRDHSVEYLHQLTDLYLFLGLKDKERVLLGRLVNDGQANAREKLAYGYYLATDKLATDKMGSVEAADMMLEVHRSTPSAFNLDTRQMLVSQLLALSRQEEVLEVLLTAYTPPVLPHEGIALAEWLVSTVDMGLVQKFLTPFEQVAEADADWYAQILKSIGDYQKLERFWITRLTGTSLDENGQKQLVNGLIDIGKAANTLPFLLQKASEGQDGWLWLYQQALTKTDRASEWNRFLETSLQNPTVPAELLASFSSRLLEASPVCAANVLAKIWTRAPSLLLGDYLAALNHLPSDKLSALALIDLLEDAKLEGEKRVVALSLLVRAQPQKIALDWLKVQANLGDEDARGQIETFFKVAGNQEQWRTWCMSEVRNIRISLKKRRQYAHALLEAGHKKDAIDSFQTLSLQSGPDATDVKTLLYLVGPRPDAKVIQWLVQQARNANGELLLAWLDHLLSVDANADVIGLTNTAGVLADDMEVTLRRLLAFSQSHQSYAFAKEMSAAMVSKPSVQWLEKAARYAQGGNFSDSALRAYFTLCELDFTRMSDCRKAGFLAFVRGDFTIARVALDRYIQRAPADAEALYNLGEIETLSGQHQLADSYYKQVLLLLASADDFKSLHLRASLFSKLGRKQEANSAYEDLLKRHPQAVDIKADYVAGLLDQQSYGRALHVLQ